MNKIIALMLSRSCFGILPAVLLLAAVPAQAQLITTNFGSDFFEIDPATGAVSQYGHTFLTPFFNTSDFRQDGLVYGLQGSSLYSVDLSAGSSDWTQLVDVEAGGQISFSPSDELYLASSSILRRVDVATGATLSQVNVTAGGSNVLLQGIDFAPDGTLYGADTTALYRIDAGSGAAVRVTPLGETATGSFIMTELDYGADHIIRAVTFNTDQPLWEIDPTTGLGTSIYTTAPLGSPYSSVASQNVPEPSSLMLLVSAGVVAVGPYLRRRRKQRLGLEEPIL